MKRFCGMMPIKEIERTETFKDKFGGEVRIDAGPNGWTVRFEDMSARYKDESIGTDANYKEAYETAVEIIGELTPMKGEAKYESR